MPFEIEKGDVGRVVWIASPYGEGHRIRPQILCGNCDQKFSGQQVTSWMTLSTYLSYLRSNLRVKTSTESDGSED